MQLGASKGERMEKEKEHLNCLIHQNAYKSSITTPTNSIFKTLMEILLCRVLLALMLERVSDYWLSSELKRTFATSQDKHPCIWLLSLDTWKFAKFCATNFKWTPKLLTIRVYHLAKLLWCSKITISFNIYSNFSPTRNHAQFLCKQSSSSLSTNIQTKSKLEFYPIIFHSSWKTGCSSQMMMRSKPYYLLFHLEVKNF